jgi:hypothetical protein
MRRSLGTAVFGGMLGVTMFGIFLTPVFYYVLQRSSERKPTAKHHELTPALEEVVVGANGPQHRAD